MRLEMGNRRLRRNRHTARMGEVRLRVRARIPSWRSTPALDPCKNLWLRLKTFPIKYPREVVVELKLLRQTVAPPVISRNRI